ncbi:hypothetical protein [Qipengyuania sp. MTN3-11]|uniref:hypothetical protein n=1 Tax=Qipengyuania sp. MTN3-11 TaxID=3056557 RepID=UPI0036F3E7B7
MALALGLVAIGGATAGMSIGASPMVAKGIGGSESFGREDGAISSAFYEPRPRQPDHYPLVTPQGTVPIAELALRGRLRNNRSGADWSEPEYIPAEDDFPDQYSLAELDDLARWEPEPGYASGRPNDAAPPVRVHRGAESAAPVGTMQVAAADRVTPTAPATPASQEHLGTLPPAQPVAEAQTVQAITPADPTP